jgi:hypothetical protein
MQQLSSAARYFERTLRCRRSVRIGRGRTAPNRARLKGGRYTSNVNGCRAEGRGLPAGQAGATRKSSPSRITTHQLPVTNHGFLIDTNAIRNQRIPLSPRQLTFSNRHELGGGVHRRDAEFAEKSWQKKRFLVGRKAISIAMTASSKGARLKGGRYIGNVHSRAQQWIRLRSPLAAAPLRTASNRMVRFSGGRFRSATDTFLFCLCRRLRTARRIRRRRPARVLRWRRCGRGAAWCC